MKHLVQRKPPDRLLPQRLDRSESRDFMRYGRAPGGDADHRAGGARGAVQHRDRARELVPPLRERRLPRLHHRIGVPRHPRVAHVDVVRARTRALHRELALVEGRGVARRHVEHEPDRVDESLEGGRVVVVGDCQPDAPHLRPSRGELVAQRAELGLVAADEEEAARHAPRLQRVGGRHACEGGAEAECGGGGESSDVACGAEDGEVVLARREGEIGRRRVAPTPDRERSEERHEEKRGARARGPRPGQQHGGSIDRSTKRAVPTGLFRSPLSGPQPATPPPLLAASAVRA
mmetsp:Transcript_6447/g.13392  ORF Transcript_6447/g.13392 Transcript_6447/m.13392 type:complete len:291 (-) Transcript_6447:174-1046(-)